MIQLYLLIFALTGIAVIVVRRQKLFEKARLFKLKKEASSKVDEMKKEAGQKEPERFKEMIQEKQEKKKFDIAAYKEEFRTAEMAIAKENWKEAKQHLIKAMGLAKDEFESTVLLAKVYKESGETKKAESIYQDLINEEQATAEVYESMAQIYTKKKRFKDAVGMYARAIELDEKDDQKLIALGKLYDLLMRPSLAAECFKRAAELKPREVEYLFMLADSCEKDDDYDNALFTYKRILTIEPYNEKAKDKSQNVKIRIHEMDEAVAHPEPITE